MTQKAPRQRAEIINMVWIFAVGLACLFAVMHWFKPGTVPTDAPQRFEVNDKPNSERF